MQSKMFTLAAVLALGNASSVPAAGQIVSIAGQHALCNGCSWAPLSVRFEAGSYVATPVTAGRHPGAQFTAYNYGMGLGWSSAYAIALDAGHFAHFGSNGPHPEAG